MIYEDNFKIPIYGYKVKLVITDDIDKYCESFDNINPSECKAIILAIGYEFIIVFHKDRLHENLIVHESFHLTAQVMRLIGCPLSINSEEAYAYLQEWIYKSLRHRTIKFKQYGNTNSPKET